MTMKLNPNKRTEEALVSIKEVFDEYLPAMPFDYRFVDQEHDRKFAAEERIGTLSGIFATLAAHRLDGTHPTTHLTHAVNRLLHATGVVG